MGTYGYISSIALFCYVFMLMLMLAGRRNRIVNSFIVLLVAMICWTGGSVLMRSLFWPNYVFWYHVSIFGLYLLPFGYFSFITEFAGKSRRFTGCIYFIVFLLLFIANVPEGFFLAAPELVEKQGNMHFVYNLNWHVAFMFAAGGIAVVHIFYTLIKYSRKNRNMSSRFGPIVLGIALLFLGQIAIMIPVFSGFPIDILSGLVNAFLILYALIKRRLFQLKLLASEGLCYGVGLFLNFVLYFNLTPYIMTWLGKTFPKASAYYSLIFAMCFLLTTMLLAFVWRSIMENVFIKDEIQQAEYLENFSKAVSKSLCVKDILDEIIHVIQKTINVQGVYICIQNQKSGDYQTTYSDRPLNDLSFTLKKDNPLVLWLQNKEGILLRDFRSTVEYRAMWEEEKRQLANLKIEACMGLKDDENLVGILMLAEKKGRRKIDIKDLKFLNSISSVASIAIKNARLYEQASYEARTDELTGLLNRKYFLQILNEEFEKNKDGSLALVIISLDDFKLYNQLYGTKSGDIALRQVAGIMRASVGESGYVARYTGKEFAVLLPKYDVFSAKNLTESIQRQIFNMNRDSDDCKLKSLTVSAGISAAPYAAQSVKELLENVDMAVYHVKRNGKNGIQVFDTLLQENMGLNSEEDHKHIYQEYESTIFALTAAIDAKDHYTFQHSKNVAYYATELAKALNLNADVIEIVRQAALLHDVGKIGIPENILGKPGKLTDEEYEIIKGHVEESIGIIRHLPSLDYVIPAVIGHHERYDGRGYPRRIAGEDIPMTARILCVADSFDAMTSKRCYKKEISIERTLEILREEEGRQFDPKIARTFSELIKDGRIQVVRNNYV